MKARMLMIQKLKRKCRPTIVLMIAGFAVSFTSVMTGISTINALLEELSKADGETPIYWTMQNTGLSLALAIYVCLSRTALSSRITGSSPGGGIWRYEKLLAGRMGN